MGNSAKILSEFTDLVNKNGAESKEVREFCRKHEQDKELSALFATVVKVQSKLKAGKLKDPSQSQRAAAYAPAAGERNR